MIVFLHSTVSLALSWPLAITTGVGSHECHAGAVTAARLLLHRMFISARDRDYLRSPSLGGSSTPLPAPGTLPADPMSHHTGRGRSVRRDRARRVGIAAVASDAARVIAPIRSANMPLLFLQMKYETALPAPPSTSFTR